MKELKRYISYIGKYKLTYWSIFVVTLVSSVILTLIYPYMNKLIFNALEYSDKDLFVRAVVLCIVLLVLDCLSPYLRYFQIRTVRKIVFDIKIRLFEKLMKLDMNYYESHHSGEALKTLNWDADSLKESYFSHIYWVFGRVISGMVSIIAMIVYSPLLTLISISFCLVTVFVSIKINQQIKRMDKDIQNKIARLTERLSDILSGFATLKMFRGSSIVLDCFQSENEQAANEE
ncbi:MAG: ABC transporter ATP-binding protein, partial [Lachnospiraceae bacterium]|nr:ABC transporter ATP-binding protein [Lachnospiraceae bacterium]